MATKKYIPIELEDLVYVTVKLLGKAVKQQYGDKTYKRVENLRQNMKLLRSADVDTVFSGLKKEQVRLAKLSTQELSEVALSFSFMLEMINRCENAYRTYQLSKKKFNPGEVKPYGIIMVLTAHPTEARSPQVLELFAGIQKLLIKWLESGQQTLLDEIYHLLLIGLKLSLARKKKPTVMDEAENIYSYILSDEILDSLIQFSADDVNLSFRAWVGGDKDGHPGVDEKTMLQSLNLSRFRLIEFVNKKLTQVEEGLKLINEKEVRSLLSTISLCQRTLKKLDKVGANDGEKVVKFKKVFDKLFKDYESYIHDPAPRLEEIKHLLWVFPALVVPLELREDSEVVAEALSSEKPLAIERMLQQLKVISNGFMAKWYARGFILSMVESHQDVLNGHKLLRRVFKRYEIPIVPLFENEKALTHAKEILEGVLNSQKSIVGHHVKHWGSRFEVMVGYSDSSKENGVFPSRFMISNALRVIEKTLSTYKLTPVFFHGSGGSIERGGGSIKEQTRWWPMSAINTYKATIQGEMVARTFGNDQIFSSRITRIMQQLNESTKAGDVHSNASVLTSFSRLVRENYSRTVKEDQFFEVVDQATPYSFLSHLKIGSRPSKRSTGGDSRKLRAIPWILCWTQNRVLFPTWWGVGSAWNKLNAKEKTQFKKEYKNNPLVSSFMNALGFTLAKVELGVWKVYLSNSQLSKSRQSEVFNDFEVEYRLALKFYQTVTGKKELLWYRPWLQQSIYYRSSMIHPLNLIQLESLKRGEIDLLLDTVTGISCGMLTTG